MEFCCDKGYGNYACFSYTQFFIFCIFFSFLFWFSNPATAQPNNQQGRTKFEVLGVRLGMTSVQVEKAISANLSNIQDNPIAGTFSNGPYTTPVLTLSEKFGGDPSSGVNMDHLIVVYSTKPNNSSIYIYRDSSFNSSSSPSVQGLVNAIQEKYGASPKVETGSGYETLTYRYDTSITFEADRASRNSCPAQLNSIDNQSIENLLLSNAYNQLFQVPYESYERCGTWVQIVIFHAGPNPLLVTEFTVRVIDFKGVVDSISYLKRSLISNAANLSSDQAEGALNNKPKL
jgi:hypothetical protein